jgi:hypothetical protein
MTQAIPSLLALAVVLGSSAAVAEGAPPIRTTPPPVAQPASAGAGQWVYTAQNGWLWVPYGQAYTYVDADSSVAYEYVYYPAFGWHWVLSPWVLGVGPSPYWGAHGYSGFAWHAHPWFMSGRHYGAGGGYHEMRGAHVAARGFHGGFHGGGHARR